MHKYLPCLDTFDFFVAQKYLNNYILQLDIKKLCLFTSCKPLFLEH